jgi:hypothetical protein
MTNRPRKFYTFSELTELAHAHGCELRYKRTQAVFSLHLADRPEQWCWIINPASGERVRLVRELDRHEWGVLLARTRDELARRNG